MKLSNIGEQSHIGDPMKRQWYGLIVLLLVILAAEASESQSARAYVSEQEVKEKLERIRCSFDKQLAMFQNVRFTAVRTQPYSRVERDSDSIQADGERRVTVTRMPGKRKITKQSYQLSKTGKFLFSYRTYVMDIGTGKKSQERLPDQTSFNGETYQHLLPHNEAVIFTPKHPFNSSGPMRKPTFYMDHLFNGEILELLEKSDHVMISETNDGLWHFKYTNPELQSKKNFNILFDPAQDFMITRIQGRWDDHRDFMKEIEYHKTEEGFYYPTKGTFTLGDNEVSWMQITEFQLNGQEGDYTLEIPDGTQVTDYSKNPDHFEKYIYGKLKKTYEKIINSGGKFVAGIVLDQSGSPIPNVYVAARCLKTTSDSGRITLHSDVKIESLNATTDAQGRFAIEVEYDGAYILRFNSPNHASIIAYDVEIGSLDLKATLPEGGSVSGHVVHKENGKKIPVVGTKVKIEDLSYVFNGLDSKETLTDERGRFRFDHLRTKKRPIETKFFKEWEYAPREWKISYGKTSKTIIFYEGTKIENVELVVEPDYTNPISLIGKPLPELKDLGTGLTATDVNGKTILLCFFEMNQRPSRHCVFQLVKKAEQLTQENVAVIAVQASKIDENTLNDWVKKNSIPFLVGMVEGSEEEMRFNWGVHSLPWLILTDRKHVVRAEGFAASELDQTVRLITQLNGDD